MFNTIKLMYENRQLRKQVKLLQMDLDRAQLTKADLASRLEEAEKQAAKWEDLASSPLL
jgi:hypothetical protein